MHNVKRKMTFPFSSRFFISPRSVMQPTFPFSPFLRSGPQTPRLSSCPSQLVPISSSPGPPFRLIPALKLLPSTLSFLPEPSSTLTFAGLSILSFPRPVTGGALSRTSPPSLPVAYRKLLSNLITLCGRCPPLPDAGTAPLRR